MDEFLAKYGGEVTGILSGFDRLVFRGTARSLALVEGLAGFLNYVGVLLKDFGSYVEKKSAQLKSASLEAALRLHRPVLYLSSSATSKEHIAEQIAVQDGVRKGLICVLKCVEPCMSFELIRDRSARKLRLEPRQRKCLFLYHYWIDDTFGFMNARVQTWFPFSIQICLNGREWLARQMDRLGLAYQRADNSFVDVQDWKRAQRLLDSQLRLSWPKHLDRIARQLNPAHDAMFAPAEIEYYWSVYQSEWATDLLFRDPALLQRLYRMWTQGAIAAFGAESVMRFLGKRLQINFSGEIISDYAHRLEGIRVKHWAQHNSIKMYDKSGAILRIETTINNPSPFRVYRPKEGDPGGELAWRQMRKGVADIDRRAQVSDASNRRYIQALSSLNTDRRIHELFLPVCRPVRWRRHRIRPLRPWAPDDLALLKAIGRAEFTINGLRNSDLLPLLFPTSHSPSSRRRLSACVSHKLRLLRAHHILRKVPRAYRYVLTAKGREIVSAISQLYDTPVTALTAQAA